MRLEDYDTSERYQALVVASRQIGPGSVADEVREIVLDVEEPSFDVAPGQSIGVLAPGRQEFGQEHHFRLYSIADVPEKRPDGHIRIPICVRRCSYIDEYSGERYDGVASNYLCDRHAGDKITVTGPFGLAFDAPEDPDAALIMIGAGTGIAPFRAFVRHLYQDVPDFKGRIFLFHGGHTGLELLYMNEKVDDFAQYYDRDTFEAVAALSSRPHWSQNIDWHSALEPRSEEIWKLLGNPHTRIYVAGLESVLKELDDVFAKVAGSEEKWARRKAELQAGERWVELLY